MTEARDRYDVVVIGGGPAGLAGALALARARRSVLVVDAGQPRNGTAEHVHNYLTREGTPPARPLAAGRAEVVGHGGEVADGQALGASRTGSRSRPTGRSTTCWPWTALRWPGPGDTARGSSASRDGARWCARVCPGRTTGAP